jgi:hypothetical protein
MKASLRGIAAISHGAKNKQQTRSPCIITYKGKNKKLPVKATTDPGDHFEDTS